MFLLYSFYPVIVSEDVGPYPNDCPIYIYYVVDVRLNEF